MTYDKIIKGLERCFDFENHNCELECPYWEKGCEQKLIKDALDLIKKQQAEIKKLRKEDGK